MAQESAYQSLVASWHSRPKPLWEEIETTSQDDAISSGVSGLLCREPGDQQLPEFDCQFSRKRKEVNNGILSHVFRW